MTGTSTHGIKAVLHPASDLAAAKKEGMTSPAAYRHVPDAR